MGPEAYIIWEVLYKVGTKLNIKMLRKEITITKFLKL
jgi:hypothetical protein